MLMLNLKNHLATLLIGDMVATTVKGGFTMLQLALALEVDSRKTVETLYSFGVTSTYHALGRFKISAAAYKDSEKPKVARQLTQFIPDNFDCDVSTPNGLKQTHVLATIACSKDVNTLENTEIPRFKQSALPSDMFH